MTPCRSLDSLRVRLASSPTLHLTATLAMLTRGAAKKDQPLPELGLMAFKALNAARRDSRLLIQFGIVSSRQSTKRLLAQGEAAASDPCKSTTFVFANVEWADREKVSQTTRSLRSVTARALCVPPPGASPSTKAHSTWSKTNAVDFKGSLAACTSYQSPCAPSLGVETGTTLAWTCTRVNSRAESYC